MNASQTRLVTRDKILDSAEEHFALHGFDGASLRDITLGARANLAAAHYHFGDKSELYKAVICRRVRPINAERLKALAEAEQRPSPPPLRLLLEILIRPMFELCSQDRGDYIARIIGRSFAEPLPFMSDLFGAEFQPVLMRFSAAIRRCLPQVPPDEFMWRLSFVIGAMHHTLSTLHRMGDLSKGICRNGDHEGALQRLLDFAIAGLEAPTTRLAARPPA